MTQAQAGERPSGSEASGGASDDEIVSKRLVAWLDAVLAGCAPNTGRFCGNCYHPRQAKDDGCPHCGTSAAEAGTVDSVPLEVIEVRTEGAVENIHKLAKKYMGLDEYPNLKPGEQRLLFVIRPDKVFGMMTDE